MINIYDKNPVDFLFDLIKIDNLPVNKDSNTYKKELIRSYLGKINLESEAHIKLISELSGGQKARVALIKLIFENPHFLLLDEPTNHLDIESVEALIDCLELYEGGILLITHEPELINRLESKIWFLDMNTKKINFNIESYDDYCDIILK